VGTRRICKEGGEKLGRNVGPEVGGRGRPGGVGAGPGGVTFQSRGFVPWQEGRGTGGIGGVGGAGGSGVRPH